MAARHSVSDMVIEDLVIERVFDASRERVFDVLTKSEHLQKWFGPKMVGHPVAEFEARPGGRIFIGESHSDGATLYLAGEVREIERPSRLVFAFHFANEKGERVSPPAGSGLPAGWEGEMVTTVTLRAEGLRTRVIVTAHKTDVTAEWLAKARYGWGESLDKLGYAIADDMKVTSTGEREIVITRTFNAPRAIVYEALTKAEYVKKWWGPRQYGPVTAVADFRPGGRYRFAQGSPQGEVAFSGEVRESSPERIVYVEEFEAMPGHGAITTVTLDERAGKTHVTVTSVYQSRADRDAVLQSGMEWGARLSYLQLDEVLGDLAA